MVFPIASNTPLEEIHAAVLDRHGVRLLVKRLDLVDPLITGNKWYKLKYNLEEAKRQGCQTLLSFGGAYSNHIYALAAAGNQFGFNTIGVIRGEPHEELNPTLQFATKQGMQLHYVSRADYRRKSETDFIEELSGRFGDFYLIPEGGSNALAVKGCKEIIDGVDEAFDVVVCACGSGGTLAGLVAGLEGKQQALGIAVLKGADFLTDDVACLLEAYGEPDHDSWQIMLDYHFGGYAKTTPALLGFVQQFGLDHGIQLEPIYTGKMMYALFDLIERGYFESGQTIVAIHSGGLQGFGRQQE